MDKRRPLCRQARQPVQVDAGAVFLEDLVGHRQDDAIESDVLFQSF
jgi:hypothetical protein